MTKEDEKLSSSCADPKTKKGFVGRIKEKMGGGCEKKRKNEKGEPELCFPNLEQSLDEGHSKALTFDTVDIFLCPEELEDDPPSIEQLLSRRCFVPPKNHIDKISSRTLATKLWTILLMMRGQLPSFLPALSLRQTIVLDKLIRLSLGVMLPLQRFPPKGFHDLVKTLWTSPEMDEVEEGVYPEDVKQMEQLLYNKEDRVFQPGEKIPTIIKSWITEFKKNNSHLFTMPKGLKDLPDMTKGSPFQGIETFSNTYHAVYLSSEFIRQLNLDDSLLNKLGSHLKAGRSSAVKTYPMSFELSSNPLTLSQIAHRFWMPNVTSETVGLIEEWDWEQYDWQWTISSIKRRPRLIHGLAEKCREALKKADERERSRKKELETMQKMDLPEHLPWGAFDNPTTSFTSPILANLTFSGLSFPEVMDSSQGTSETANDWDFDISDELPPVPMFKRTRSLSSTTIYSTDSEHSITSIKSNNIHPDCISLASLELVDP